MVRSVGIGFRYLKKKMPSFRDRNGEVQEIDLNASNFYSEIDGGVE